jgi:hypothetical protein
VFTECGKIINVNTAAKHSSSQFHSRKALYHFLIAIPQTPKLPLINARHASIFPLSLLSSSTLLLPLENNSQAHKRQHHSLEPRVLGQQNSNVTHKRNVTDHTTHDVCLAGQEVLASGVEFGVVCCVVVAFCEELEGRCFGTVFESRLALERQEERKKSGEEKERKRGKEKGRH